MPERDYLTETDIRLIRLEGILGKQRREYGPAHDRRHENFEWLGLIVQYAAAGRWIDAAALCISADLVNSAQEQPND